MCRTGSKVGFSCLAVSSIFPVEDWQRLDSLLHLVNQLLSNFSSSLTCNYENTSFYIFLYLMNWAGNRFLRGLHFRKRSRFHRSRASHSEARTLVLFFSGRWAPSAGLIPKRGQERCFKTLTL
jgi:hypothetical protein